ncbi:MAG: hypothetical protein J6Y26_03530 [Lachnospiraceae bacterium]|nr:hypothetical protein [Lachnospiraceae bacterium]
MGSNAVKLGTGAATGMFFHAPSGTALPTYPTDTLGSDWTEVGYVAEDGITWHHGRSATPLKDWSNSIRRMLQDDATGTVSVPIISTTKEVLETLFGSGNVIETAATTGHGKLEAVEVKEGVISGEEAFLFLMKDGDDTIMLGTTKGFITTLDDISFAPGSAITWGATVSADAWKLILDDGQVVPPGP